jgi:S-DNA-T family DNA segregation ATPase FtsK/SpoIIIE
MAKEQKQQSTPTLGQEVVSVCGVFLAVFLLLCFASYSQSSAGSGVPRLAAANWGGAVGYYIAFFLFNFLGVSSYWLIFLLLFFSVQFFFSRTSVARLPQIFAGSSGLLIASSGLLAVAAGGNSGLVALLGHTYPAGGSLGSVLFVFLHRYFGGPGSILLLLLLFLFSLMIAVRFSPYFAGRRLIATGSRLATTIRNRKSDQPAKRVREKKGVIREEIAPAVMQPAQPQVHEPERLLVDAEDSGEFEVVPVSPGEYRLPGIALLDRVDQQKYEVDKEHYFAVSKKLEDIFSDFGVAGKVVGISPGPVITTYEYAPAPGVKINKIVSLADDIALGLKTESVRVVGSIPGKAALGIEIPNPKRAIVHIRDIVANETFQGAASKLTLALGLDVVGKPVYADLAKMPHLLIAGATGSGKSVAINTIICSILFKATPEEVRLLMVDPKRIELSGYEDIPHLLHPVVVHPKMASRALQWAVREMERRYELMEEKRVKNIITYNEISEERLPLIVIIIDELADLMMVSSRDVEASITRLAQMARAAGMHLILATQRPSVDVLTGLIKANFPTRLSFKVSTRVDSRTILDVSGAEHLLGAGDLLFLPPGTARLQRIHGAYISENETERIVAFLKEQGTAQYDESVLRIVEASEDDVEVENGEEYDEKYDEAVALVCETGQASISMVQRRLRVGYNRAARMIEIMEKEGIVGPSDGSKPREVLARKNY